MLDAFSVPLSVYIGVFLVLASSYILGETFQHYYSSLFSDALITFGSLWFVGIVHFFFASLGYDIFKLTNYFFHFISQEGMKMVAYHLTWLTVVATVVMIVAGYVNARTPVIREQTIMVHKKNPVTDTLRIAVASDIHLGPINGGYHAERVVAQINALKPDLILLPGDILDGEVDPVIRRDLGERLRKLSAQYGVYGSLGNHEYIGGVDRAANYLMDHTITLLRDSITPVAGITLIGRDDISGMQFGKIRSNLEDLVSLTDPETALILMDHQPKNLFEAEQNKIDVQFSGHTHNGQLWPLNYIVSQVFELARGYKQKGNTHIFVSSGVGTWGPPVRTNARPEILLVTLKFQSGS
ncbi:MAG: metallophosphoesterase [Candidatus Gracilibacteria bacterium]